MADPHTFFERWSRLKRLAASEKPLATSPATASSAVPASAVSVKPEEDPLKDLPPIESLGRESDYSAFMGPGVPEELRNQALRKLWASDPVFANLDGLVEYGENFAEPFETIGAVATLYRVLEGMPQPEPTADASPQPRAPETPPAPAKVERPDDSTSGANVGRDKVNILKSTSASDEHENRSS